MTVDTRSNCVAELRARLTDLLEHGECLLIYSYWVKDQGNDLPEYVDFGLAEKISASHLEELSNLFTWPAVLAGIRESLSVFRSARMRGIDALRKLPKELVDDESVPAINRWSAHLFRVLNRLRVLHYGQHMKNDEWPDEYWVEGGWPFELHPRFNDNMNRIRDCHDEVAAVEVAIDAEQTGNVSAETDEEAIETHPQPLAALDDVGAQIVKIAEDTTMSVAEISFLLNSRAQRDEEPEQGSIFHEVDESEILKLLGIDKGAEENATSVETLGTQGNSPSDDGWILASKAVYQLPFIGNLQKLYKFAKDNPNKLRLRPHPDRKQRRQANAADVMKLLIEHDESVNKAMETSEASAEMPSISEAGLAKLAERVSLVRAEKAKKAKK